MIREDSKMKDDKEEGPLKDEDGNLIIRLAKDDSALVVHANGGIELISTELNPDNDSEYLGDIEDLNKTFSLVLALAASLENEDLYNRIFHNLNAVLMKKWENLDDVTKDNIKDIRDKKKKEEAGDLGEFYQMEEDFLRKHKSRLTGKGPTRNQSKKPLKEIKMKIKKQHPLAYLKNIQWATKDKSLKAHFKEYQADISPPIKEDDE